MKSLIQRVRKTANFAISGRTEVDVFVSILLYAAVFAIGSGVGYQFALIRVRREAWEAEQAKLARKKKAAEKAANKRRNTALNAADIRQQATVETARQASTALNGATEGRRTTWEN